MLFKYRMTLIVLNDNILLLLVDVIDGKDPVGLNMFLNHLSIGLYCGLVISSANNMKLLAGSSTVQTST